MSKRKEANKKYEAMSEAELESEAVRLQKIVDEEDHHAKRHDKLRNEANAELRTVHSRLVTVRTKRKAA